MNAVCVCVYVLGWYPIHSNQSDLHSEANHSQWLMDLPPCSVAKATRNPIALRNSLARPQSSAVCASVWVLLELWVGDVEGWSWLRLRWLRMSNPVNRGFLFILYSLKLCYAPLKEPGKSVWGFVSNVWIMLACKITPLLTESSTSASFFEAEHDRYCFCPSLWL